jgi:O-acetylhomoserine/O-acetylserine sulfhydrylase-like pyridoxal-dependent enzyme
VRIFQGMKMPLIRMDRHNENAVAKFLRGHDKIKWFIYSGLYKILDLPKIINFWIFLIFF